MAITILLLQTIHGNEKGGFNFLLISADFLSIGSFSNFLQTQQNPLTKGFFFLFKFLLENLIKMWNCKREKRPSPPPVRRRKRFSSAHCGHRCLPALLHFAALAHGLHFVHDVSEGLLHRLLQDPAFALTLRVLRVGQRRQRAVDILQANSHCHLQLTGT